jgi:general secretion pathway protein H
MVAAGQAQRERLRSRLRGRSRGFTLLEVIIVVVIIGVIAMMSLPTIQAGSRQAAVRRSVRAFISAARQASARAVTTRKPTALIVWPDDGTFGVEGIETRVELPDFADFGDIEGGRAAEGDEEIRFDFYPTGSAAGGSIQIEFTPADRRQAYTLIIDPLIGRVRIEEDS